ncbi:hypothetical protein MLD38_026988 [Melastoma candidum]|uniref:Uncharacterized protein n=1 Tax=Melastoma candidum TaxID=119954 RepID=A0ACB9P6H9_9MYRT|nr:hypothetical protein MLD38_026988 [Melastoma candidum]
MNAPSSLILTCPSSCFLDLLFLTKSIGLPNILLISSMACFKLTVGSTRPWWQTFSTTGSSSNTVLPTNLWTTVSSLNFPLIELAPPKSPEFSDDKSLGMGNTKALTFEEVELMDSHDLSD